MRPSFNDSASSLLFALAAFLHEYNAHNLWQYLLSSNGQLAELHLALGLLRQDLKMCIRDSHSATHKEEHEHKHRNSMYKARSSHGCPPEIVISDAG